MVMVAESLIISINGLKTNLGCVCEILQSDGHISGRCVARRKKLGGLGFNMNFSNVTVPFLSHFCSLPLLKKLGQR